MRRHTLGEAGRTKKKGSRSDPLVEGKAFCQFLLPFIAFALRPVKPTEKTDQLLVPAIRIFEVLKLVLGSRQIQQGDVRTYRRLTLMPTSTENACCRYRPEYVFYYQSLLYTFLTVSTIAPTPTQSSANHLLH